MKLLYRVYNFSIFKSSPFTPIYGAARSILAFGTLITLSLNDIHFLIDEQLYDQARASGSMLARINFFSLFGYEHLVFAKATAIVLLLLIISGYFPRFTGVIHWWISFSFNSIAILVDGGDQVTSVVTFLLIPITILDKRRNHWFRTSTSSSPNTNLLANAFVFFISLQMAIVYLQAAMEKLYKLNEWSSGTALYYYLQDPIFGTSEWLLSLTQPFLNAQFVFFLSWSVIILELCLFSALFMSRRKKMIFYYVALLFHFIIILFLGLFSFFFAMMGGLIIYLLPRDINIREMVLPNFKRLFGAYES